MIGQVQVDDQITEIVPQLRRGLVILDYPDTWDDVKQSGRIWLAIGDTPLVQRGFHLDPGEKVVLDALSEIFQLPAINGIMASGSAWLAFTAPNARVL